MTTPQLPAEAPLLADVLAENGDEWQIQQDAGVGVWTAVQRPTPTSQHILVDFTLAGLAAKLRAESNQASG